MEAEADLSELSLDQLVELERRAAEREAAALADGGDGGSPPDAGGDGGVVLLPWWQHPVNILTMVLTAAILAGMIGWLVGDAGTEQPHNAADNGFLQDMRLHHEQAVLISDIYLLRPDTAPGLRIIARSISHGQSIEVGRMVQLLRIFGEPEAADLEAPVMAWMGMATSADQMLGLASDEDLDRLGRVTGREADELFAELMIAHHEGGIHMADEVVGRGANAEVRKMATSMAKGQREEIGELRRELD